jgi:hypothetical protein
MTKQARNSGPVSFKEKSMEELLLKMMKHGLILYPDKDLWLLKKVVTHSSPTALLDNGETLKQFPSFDEAVAHAKLILEGETSKQVQGSWSKELLYKHRGFNRPRVEQLGIALNASYEDALTDTRQHAERWLKEQFPDDEVLGWEVRIRPVRSN